MNQIAQKIKQNILIQLNFKLFRISPTLRKYEFPLKQVRVQNFPKFDDKGAEIINQHFLSFKEEASNFFKEYY